MKQILHILTKKAENSDAVTTAVIKGQRASAELNVVVIDLTAGEPDYRNVVREIFAADSIEVW